jgi:hypothetical protein
MKSVKQWLDGISRTEPVALSPILRAVQIDAIRALATRIENQDGGATATAEEMIAEIERDENSYANKVGVS